MKENAIERCGCELEERDAASEREKHKERQPRIAILAVDGIAITPVDQYNNNDDWFPLKIP